MYNSVMILLFSKTSFLPCTHAELYQTEKAFCKSTGFLMFLKGVLALIFIAML